MKYQQAPLLHSYPSTWGSILLAATDQGLCGIWFDGQKHLPDTRTWCKGRNSLMDEAAEQLNAYFLGQRSRFDISLDLRAGTVFQQSVWQALLKIEFGQYESYGAIAQRIGNSAAVRAVGAAVGRNPISVIVPCHRVLGADGALTGYAGGLARKTALLELEGVLPKLGLLVS
jgi:methylated-DNA-[protein]-cysteine S-methyltransferase